MPTNLRCLYTNTFNAFLTELDMAVFGRLNDGYHGIDLTTQREAWKSEIEIMRATLEGMIDRDSFRNKTKEILLPRLLHFLRGRGDGGVYKKGVEEINVTDKFELEQGNWSR